MLDGRLVQLVLTKAAAAVARAWAEDVPVARAVHRRFAVAAAKRPVEVPGGPVVFDLAGGWAHPDPDPDAPLPWPPRAVVLLDLLAKLHALLRSLLGQPAFTVGHKALLGFLQREGIAFHAGERQ
jgi:hypothetical protein